MKDRQEQFVRNNADKEKGIFLPFGRALKYAFSGVWYVLRTQRNLKIQVIFAGLALVLGFICAIPLSSWLAVVLCIGSVFAAECINTAIESTIDLVSPEFDPLAKRAKDCAAAAVLCLSFISLVVGIIVFAAPLLSLFNVTF